MVFSIALYSNKAEKKAIRGEMIHERMIFKMDKKCISAPEAIPEPVKLPISTWCVERGNFFQLERMIKKAATDRDMLIIGRFTSRMSFPTVFMTF